MDPRTDTELVKLARLGHKNAFSSLIERYQPMARRLALSMVNNENIAKELVQEAMLQAYLSLGQLNHMETKITQSQKAVEKLAKEHSEEQKRKEKIKTLLFGGNI